MEEEARRRLSTNRRSPPSKNRARRGGDSSCTEASDVERLVAKASDGRAKDPTVKSRQLVSLSDVSPSSSPRGGVRNGGGVYRPLPSPRTWRTKPDVALKPSRRKRSSIRDRDDEAWVADVVSTVQEKLQDRLVQHNMENRQQVFRIRKLEDDLKTKEEENGKKDAEIKKLRERVRLLEDLLKTADIQVS